MNGTLLFYECKLNSGDTQEVMETLKPSIL